MADKRLKDLDSGTIDSAYTFLAIDNDYAGWPEIKKCTMQDVIDLVEPGVSAPNITNSLGYPITLTTSKFASFGKLKTITAILTITLPAGINTFYLNYEAITTLAGAQNQMLACLDEGSPINCYCYDQSPYLRLRIATTGANFTTGDHVIKISGTLITT